MGAGRVHPDRVQTVAWRVSSRDTQCGRDSFTKCPDGLERALCTIWEPGAERNLWALTRRLLSRSGKSTSLPSPLTPA